MNIFEPEDCLKLLFLRVRLGCTENLSKKIGDLLFTSFGIQDDILYITLLIDSVIDFL